MAAKSGKKGPVCHHDGKTPCSLPEAARTLGEDPGLYLSSTLYVACMACEAFYDHFLPSLRQKLENLKFGQHDKWILNHLYAEPRHTSATAQMLESGDASRQLIDSRRRSLKKLLEHGFLEEVGGHVVVLTKIGLLFCTIFEEPLESGESVRWTRAKVEVPADDPFYRNYLFLTEAKRRYKYREMCEVIAQLEK